MKSVNDFALGLVSVFIPIYLLDLGYSLQSVFGWFLVLFTSFTITIFITVYSTNRIGFVNTFYIRFLFLISHLGLLLILPEYPQVFFLIAVFTGLVWAFFCIPLNILFVVYTIREKTGTALSKISAYPEILGMFSPLVGAFIILQFGFPVLFIIAMLLALLSITRLFPLKSERSDFRFTLNHTREIYTKYKSFFKTEIIARFAEDTGMIWSIFVYIQLASKFEAGMIATIAKVVGILFVLTLGKLTDEWNKHKLLKIGATAVTLAWVLSFVIGSTTLNPWFFYLATLAMGLSLKAFLIPYRTILWNSGRKDDAQFIVLREIPSCIGKIILLLSAIILYDRLNVLFLLIGIAFVYFIVLDSRKIEVAD